LSNKKRKEVKAYFQISSSVTAMLVPFPHLSHIIPAVSPIIVDAVVVFIMWWNFSGVIAKR